MRKNESFATAALILIAFLFSVAVRYLWVAMMGDNESFLWNGQMMINTNDGYFWAEGARDILSGITQENDRSPVNQIASQLTAFFVYLLPFRFETVILYMPAFLSSLVVIPIVLIGRALGNLTLGFIAALISSIAWSYYNRTMAGYFDTDMLNIVFPIFLLWSLIVSFKTQKSVYLLVMALDIIAYRLWYQQSYSLEFSFFVLLLSYVLLVERKNSFYIKLLIIMLAAMVYLPVYVRIALVIAFFLYFKREKIEKHLYYLLALVFIVFLVTGGLNPIWVQLKGYVFSDSAMAVGDTLKLHYFSVMQTISEAGKIPFERFADRISGHVILFLLAVAGYGLLIYRHKVMLLALPLVGLGFLAYGIPGVIGGGGLRFTIYAVVPMAFGLGYLFLQTAAFVTRSVETASSKKALYYAALTVLTAAALTPNLQHVIDYKVPTVMSANEVAALDKLHNIASREDYVVSWWDYGYPVRYYSDVKTLGDGGAHSGEINYPISLALTMPQNISAKASRMAVEANERPAKGSHYLVDILQNEKLSSVQDYYDYLESDSNSSLLKKTREIYYYLPFRMTSIFPVVESFRNVDIFTGTKLPGTVFRNFQFQNLPDRFQLAQGLYFSKRDGKLYQGNNAIPLKMFYQSSYDQNGSLAVKKQLLNMTGKLNLLFLPNYGQIILLDDQALNSTYVQLFFFENYDQNFFEPVILSPESKIYKLKI